jgi:hypothetical protein
LSSGRKWKVENGKERTNTKHAFACNSAELKALQEFYKFNSAYRVNISVALLPWSLTWA